MKRSYQINLIGCLSIIIIFNNILFGELITKEFLMSLLPNDPVVVEAGAHNGSDTEIMAKLWHKGTIHAFEPVPSLFDDMKIRCSDYGNCFFYQVALGEKNEKRPFYVSSGGGDASSSLLQPAAHLSIFSHVLFNTVISVDVVTLDYWAQQNNISKIDLLWLDMQGGEPAMLRASPNILKTVSVIFTEVNTKELYKGCELFPSFKNWLTTQGFVLLRSRIDEALGYGDAVFVRKSDVE